MKTASSTQSGADSHNSTETEGEGLITDRDACIEIECYYPNIVQDDIPLKIAEALSSESATNF